MKITIRSAKPEDETTVTTLWRACGLVTQQNDPAADFRFAQGRETSEVLLGEDENQTTIGTVMVGHDGHRGWLYYVASSPDARGVGIGRSLVSAAEAWLRDRGVLKAQLMVRETNTGVVPFYERLGYETAPRIVMGKWL
ncbi:GNAT family acetyltransferase [Acetobacter sacchari]|uniref:GNAT family acetyltransferase n=1 Tax=Acetobacter sacchari TaxID=2661687 RepID=A0ABS3LZI2_9PROT|nr:GNAT family acetyltransferase [Acetobacter sacchari]MBO1361333.1 GNAT family acetyltransferase [Acetobacter sacchari]